MKTYILLSFFLGSLVVFAHSSATHTRHSYHNFKETSSIDSLSVSRGDSLFTSNCFGCHATVVSHAYTTEGWNTILTRMTVNAGLDSTQSIDLSNYIFDQLSKTDSSNVTRTVGAYRQW